MEHEESWTIHQKKKTKQQIEWSYRTNSWNWLLGMLKKMILESCTENESWPIEGLRSTRFRSGNWGVESTVESSCFTGKNGMDAQPSHVKLEGAGGKKHCPMTNDQWRVHHFRLKKPGVPAHLGSEFHLQGLSKPAPEVTVGKAPQNHPNMVDGRGEREKIMGKPTGFGVPMGPNLWRIGRWFTSSSPSPLTGRVPNHHSWLLRHGDIVSVSPIYGISSEQLSIDFFLPGKVQASIWWRSELILGVHLHHELLDLMFCLDPVKQFQEIEDGNTVLGV